MYRYYQFCPIAKALEVLGDRWTLLIARELLLGRTQFGELQHGLPRISPTTLSKRLGELQAYGLVVRKPAPGRQGIEYQLTDAGRELYPVVIQLGEWGMRWVRRRIDDQELDVGILMADIGRRVDTSKLPGGQSILRFRFTDVDPFADWWLKIHDGEVDLCLDDPGFEVDVYFTSDLRTLTEVWMGDVPIKEARDDGRLKIVGHPAYLANLRAWFPLHVMAHIRPAAGP